MPEAHRKRARCVGYQQITNVAAAVGFTLPTKDLRSGELITPTIAIVIATAQAVRWRGDGTDPTAAIGMPLAVNVYHTFEGDLANYKFFEQAGGAILNVEYYESDH